MTRRSSSPIGLFVVDRREGDKVIVIDEAGQSTDVRVELLPPRAGTEGAVLRVPLGAGGGPEWEKAVRDRREERRRRAEIAKRIQRLADTDRGGDIVL